MTQNKKTIEDYMEGFRRSDHARVLACLTDDVEWIMPGFFHLNGKGAFDKEIENPAFEGPPEITVTRVVEENDVVVAEGKVRGRRRDGGAFEVVFCDVFIMHAGKIKQLISYVMEIRGGA